MAELSEIHVGVHVVALDQINECIHPGATGTICQTDIRSDCDITIGICWDIDDIPTEEIELAGLHSCGGRCEDGRGWYIFNEECIDVIDDISEREFDPSDIGVLFA